jgi:hypothetical protein
MAGRTAPMQMARKLVRLLRSERPDHLYLKKVFQKYASAPVGEAGEGREAAPGITHRS